MEYFTITCCVGTSSISTHYDTSGGVEEGPNLDVMFSSCNKQMMLIRLLIFRASSKYEMCVYVHKSYRLHSVTIS